ncbi:unnamed protein product [Leptosia nina]|uniref:Peptidase S1 domain-containing protein n=1 Tax=Leptosia nina TaxID=320188 RepID=A0AAV1IZI5_9NEOP
MVSVEILLCLVLISTCKGDTSTLDFSDSDLESIILKALQDNETLSTDFSSGADELCKPFNSVKPDFHVAGQRISVTKCLEYKWEIKNQADEDVANEKCRTYLISQIKRGIIPEILVFVPPSVIFGGVDAKPAEFPHMGAIGWKAKDESKWVFKCGGSLISEKYVLTAAHCTWLPIRKHLDVSKATPEVIRFGVENIEDYMFQINGKPIDMTIKTIIKHPRYKPPQKYYDIALIELEAAVKFSHTVRPACLFTERTLDTGSKGILTGWGVTESGNPSTVLQKAVVDIFTTGQCNPLLQDTWNRNWHGFAKHQLCAGKLAGKVDTCQGDSGGPLQIKIDSGSNATMSTVVGLTSFGVKCGQKDKPGIYTKVSSFRKWIENIVWGHKDSPVAQNKTEGPSLFKRKNITLSGGLVTF